MQDFIAIEKFHWKFFLFNQDTNQNVFPVKFYTFCFLFYYIMACYYQLHNTHHDPCPQN